MFHISVQVWHAATPIQLYRGVGAENLQTLAPYLTQILFTEFGQLLEAVIALMNDCDKVCVVFFFSSHSNRTSEKDKA